MKNIEQAINKTEIVGTVIKKFAVVGEVNYQPLYEGIVEVRRKNGNFDYFSVLCLEKNLPVYYCTGIKLKICGALRSFRDNKVGEHNPIHLSLAMESGFVVDEVEEHDSSITILEGFIPQQKYCNDNPDGYARTAIVLCVPRNGSYTDYIPCTAWDDNAEILKGLSRGIKVRIEGRYKNREYLKQQADGSLLAKKTQEVIIYNLSIIQA